MATIAKMATVSCQMSADLIIENWESMGFQVSVHKEDRSYRKVELYNRLVCEHFPQFKSTLGVPIGSDADGIIEQVKAQGGSGFFEGIATALVTLRDD